MYMYGLYVPCNHLWIVDHVVHLGNYCVLWVEPVEVSVMGNVAQVSNYYVIACWSKEVVHDIHQEEEILPIFIVFWYKISHQKREIPCQAPYL